MPVPIVLLHAFPLDARMWQPQLEALPEFDIIAPNLRGVSIDEAADDVAELLDQRKVEQAVVGGISRGGYVALAFARRHPRRLRGLMLFDTRATPAGDDERQSFATMAERLQSEGIAFLPGAMRSRLFGPNAHPEVIQQVDQIILSQSPLAVAAAARGMASRPDARPGLASIQVPVLLLAGTEDAAFNDTKAIAGAIPGSRFLEVPGAGHLTNLERPEIVTDAIRSFCASLEMLTAQPL